MYKRVILVIILIYILIGVQYEVKVNKECDGSIM